MSYLYGDFGCEVVNSSSLLSFVSLIQVHPSNRCQRCRTQPWFRIHAVANPTHPPTHHTPLPSCTSWKHCTNWQQSRAGDCTAVAVNGYVWLHGAGACDSSCVMYRRLITLSSLITWLASARLANAGISFASSDFKLRIRAPLFFLRMECVGVRIISQSDHSNKISNVAQRTAILTV